MARHVAKYVRSGATCLGDDSTHVVSLGDGHDRTPAVCAHSEAGPTPLLLAGLDTGVCSLISAGACGAGVRTGDEGKEEGKREEEVHQAIHCCLKLKPRRIHRRKECNSKGKRVRRAEEGGGAGDNAERGALRRRRLEGRLT